MTELEYQPKPIDRLPLNNRMKNIMVLYPELVEQLLPIKIALEWLEGTDFQLDQLLRNKKFYQSGDLINRDSSGLEGDNPLQGNDPYLYLNDDICKAMGALNLKRLSKHIQTLITRDRLLSEAMPHKRMMEKTTYLAKKTGSKGGVTSATKIKPLHDEIKRLFLLQKKKRPDGRLTEYAHEIEISIEAFINENKDKHWNVGSPAGANGELNYYEYIYRQLRLINPSKRKKQP